MIVGLVVVLVGMQGSGARLRAGPTQAVSDDPQLTINVNTSPVVAVDPRRPDTFVVASRVDAPQLQCAVSVSTTAGEAWRRLDLPLPPEATNCFWPDVAFDADANLLVLYTPTGGPFNLPTGLWLQRFTPELNADGPPLEVSGPLTFQPRLAVDARTVFVSWIKASEARSTKPLGFGPPPNPIVVTRSVDGGRTFSAPVTVSEPTRLAVQPTLLAWGRDHVVVGALDLGDDRETYQSSHEGQPGPPPAGPWRLVTWTSTDGGASFAPATTVAEGLVPSQRVLIDLAPAPAFAVDAARGRLYAAWESGSDVHLARSDDAGRTWSPPRRLEPSRGGQFLPGLGIAPDGRVDVAFYDRSADPADVLARMVLASSHDGGRTFVTSTVSEQPFDSIVGSFSGDNVMLGSHVAVASQPDRVTAVWPDTTRGNRVNNIVDLVSASVEIRSGTNARTPLVAGGAALVLIGAAVTALSWPRSGSARGPSTGHLPPASRPPVRRGL
jgi:hypothetical protein